MRRLTPLEQTEAIRSVKIILRAPREDVPLKVKGSIGDASLTEAIYTPILDIMADHKARTLNEVYEAVKDRDISLPQVIQASLLLSSQGYFGLVQEEHITLQVKTRADALNSNSIARARGSSDVEFLLSPVTGEGVGVDRFQQLFLLANDSGMKTPAEWAE